MNADSAPVIRRFTGSDASHIDRLAAPEIERSAYPSAWRAAVDGISRGSDPDARGLIAVRESLIIAFVLYGSIAGSEGAGRIQLVVTHPRFRRAGIARRLVESAADDLVRSGARFVIAEMPEDPALSPALSLLDRCGFSTEARVSDFYRDGVGMAVFRRDLRRR